MYSKRYTQRRYDKIYSRWIHFVLVNLFICICFNDAYMRVCYCWQEDFQALTYGFKLSCDVSDNRIMGMLREVEEEISKVIRVGKIRSIVDTVIPSILQCSIGLGPCFLIIVCSNFYFSVYTFVIQNTKFKAGVERDETTQREVSVHCNLHQSCSLTFMLETKYCSEWTTYYGLCNGFDFSTSTNYRSPYMPE